ncbi:MAG: cupin domain-containing protein [Rubricoccaceae bacterium]|nr:cupin domain-containing protein [Rubricoccaceae bacterium]
MNLNRGHRITAAEALEQLPAADGRHFITLFEHGTLQVEMYAPQGRDLQQPHKRDEVYVVVRGSGTFFCDGTRTPFGTGDFLFVPAGIEHRFEDFSDDFAVWVFFYGLEGGEAGSPAE